MGDVERYNPDAREVGCMESHLMGDYIRFEDYRDLLAQRDALAKVLDWDWCGLRQMPDHVDWNEALEDIRNAEMALEASGAKEEQ